MLTQKSLEGVYEKQIKDAMGAKADAFSSKLKWLQDKWKAAGDTATSRIISPIVLNKTTPINVAIIADNLDYFQKHYKTECENAFETALAKACLCGSREIAEFLLVSELKSSYTAPAHQYLLSLVSASTDASWAKSIAKNMAKANIAIPTSVYGLATSDKLIDEIGKIFNDANAPKSTAAPAANK